MWNKFAVAAVAATALGALTACATSPAIPDLASRTWKLTELGGQPASKQVLTFDVASGHASGNGGCNNFTAGYQWTPKSLRMGPVASTRRACMDDSTSRQETAYFKALEDTRTWQSDGKTLTLSGDSGPLARFAAQ